jgi:signal transduction histidine kinase
MVSHDMNNLLAGIVMTLESISITVDQTGKPVTEQGKRIAKGEKYIKIYVARMKKLVADLVDVTSITAGKLRVSTEPSDSSNLIAEVVETFRMLAAEKEISLKSGIAGPPLLADADQGRIMQVLTNLVANAIKFTSQGGHILVNVKESGDNVLFSVKDDGPGIAESLHESMFERFWQVNKNDTRGTGLGLYISRNIVEAHGGKIWAESRPGEGSIFYFTLPMAGMKPLRSGAA